MNSLRLSSADVKPKQQEDEEVVTACPDAMNVLGASYQINVGKKQRE